jgi:hypothetical protein
MRRLLPAIALAAAGCQNWPLYLHLPDPEQPTPDPERVEVAEDEALPEGTTQDLGEVAAPAIVTVSGTADSCGFDPEAPWPVWPNHPTDLDGDGEADETRPWYSGWYSGDVDGYVVAAAGDAWLDVSLSWANAPPGDANAPYRPAEPEGAWAAESDLDFVLFSVDADGALDSVLTDAGFSSRYPEHTLQVIPLGPGGRIAAAVGCHHAVGTAYTLRLELFQP